MFSQEMYPLTQYNTHVYLLKTFFFYHSICQNQLILSSPWLYLEVCFYFLLSDGSRAEMNGPIFWPPTWIPRLMLWTTDLYLLLSRRVISHRAREFQNLWPYLVVLVSNQLPHTAQHDRVAPVVTQPRTARVGSSS